MPDNKEIQTRREAIRDHVLKSALGHMNMTSFAGQALCEGMMTSRIGMAVAMNSLAHAKNASVVLELCNPMAPKNVELPE